MKKLAIALAGLAAIGFSGAAFADEATTGPAAMTDSEMDGVTAAGHVTIMGEGRLTAGQASVDKANPMQNKGLPPSLKGFRTSNSTSPANPPSPF